MDSLYLKEANLDDVDKEYIAIKNIPEDENGYRNDYYGISEDDFKNKYIYEIINHSKGIGLKEGRVPDTYYFLWNNNEIVGLFKIRHYLNDFLRTGPGHVGYGILKEYRGKGYATQGLKLAIDICKNLIKEDEIYLSVHKNNPASLKVQQKNGAIIAGENNTEYFTRIKLYK